MDSLIRTVRHFISLSDEEGVVVRGLFTESRLRPGDYFLEEGKICWSVAGGGDGVVPDQL